MKPNDKVLTLLCEMALRPDATGVLICVRTKDGGARIAFAGGDCTGFATDARDVCKGKTKQSPAAPGASL